MELSQLGGSITRFITLYIVCFCVSVFFSHLVQGKVSLMMAEQDSDHMYSRMSFTVVLLLCYIAKQYLLLIGT